MDRLPGKLVMWGILIALLMALFQHFYPSVASALGGAFLVYAFWPRRRCGVCGNSLNRVNQARHDWWLDGGPVPVCLDCDKQLVRERGGNAKTPSYQ
jgi:hypothetical protein